MRDAHPRSYVCDICETTYQNSHTHMQCRDALKAKLAEVMKDAQRWRDQEMLCSSCRVVWPLADLVGKLGACPKCGNVCELFATARLRAELGEARRERDAYKRAKAENDERFMTERDQALAENKRLRAALGRVYSRLVQDVISEYENAEKGDYKTILGGMLRDCAKKVAALAAKE